MGEFISKPFTVRTSLTNYGFRFFRVYLEGKKTTVSLDPVLVEQLEAILGSENIQPWVNSTANRVNNIMMANLKEDQRIGGLSRMVSRESWRFVLDPDQGHLQDLNLLNRKHPLLS